MVRQSLPVPYRLARTVRHWLLFVLIGVATAAVGEWQFSVLIRGDWTNLLGSVVFNAFYLTGAFLLTRLLLRLMPRRAALLITALLAAACGLAVEWFLIGNSPWGNPAASQIGMAAYWASIVLVPWLLIDLDPRLHPLKRAIVVYALGYVALATLGQWLIAPAEWRFAFHVWAVVLGYLGLVGVCVVALSKCYAFTQSQSS